MNLPLTKECQIHQHLSQFLNTEVLPLVNLDVDAFWRDFTDLLAEFAPRNQELLSKRDYLQSQIDEFHKTHRSFTTQQYQEFLTDIGYLLPEGEDFTIETQNLDQEITSMLRLN